jgi:hypothetical protein
MVMDGNGEWLSGLMNVGELFCRLKGLYSTYIYKYMYRERETYRDIKRHTGIHIHIIYILFPNPKTERLPGTLAAVGLQI